MLVTIHAYYGKNPSRELQELQSGDSMQDGQTDLPPPPPPPPPQQLRCAGGGGGGGGYNTKVYHRLQ